MATETMLTIFIPLLITLAAALGGVWIFRGKYYEGLASRVDHLEEKDTKNYQEIQRLREENETLRRLVTGEIALERLIELDRQHEHSAKGRHMQLISLLERLREEIKAP